MKCCLSRGFQRDSNPQPLDLKSVVLTARPRRNASRGVRVQGNIFWGIQRKITFSSRFLFCKYGGTTVIKTILGTGEQLFH